VSALEAIALSFEQLRQAAAQIVIADLPMIEICDREIWARLPCECSAVYFVTHPIDGVLYIGKTAAIRQRWASTYRLGRQIYTLNHSKHAQALDLGDCELSWLEIDRCYLAALEAALIGLHLPPWNLREKYT
jgi:excinuclease UvrABC nuclease subunit